LIDIRNLMKEFLSSSKYIFDYFHPYPFEIRISRGALMERSDNLPLSSSADLLSPPTIPRLGPLFEASVYLSSSTILILFQSADLLTFLNMDPFSTEGGEC
jgi:hypothetical protein